MNRLFRRLFRLLLAILILGGGGYLLYDQVFRPESDLRPTQAYYVNDFAGVLEPAVESTIIREGDRLYQETAEEEHGGAQVVFITISFELESELAQYDKVELFRKWQIGDNNMGLLVLMFFQETDNGLTFYEIQTATGYWLSVYLTPIETSNIIDNTLFETDDLSMGLIHMYYEFLSVIYVDAYGYSSFNYDMEDYRDYLDTFVPEEDLLTEISSTWLWYLFSPFGSLEGKLFSGGAMLILILMLGGFAVRVGGGGNTGGAGVFRRRR